MSNQNNFRSFLIWSVSALILIIGLLVVVKLSAGGGSPVGEVGAAKILSSGQAVVRPVDQVRGSRVAKVVLVEYSDFQCPACSFIDNELKKISAVYGDRLSIVYRHFPLPMHQNSVSAAIAAEAAGRQGQFWGMADLLFAKQDEWGQTSDALAKFTTYAATLGLDREQFLRDYADPTLKQKVDLSYQEAETLRLEHTPTLFINGREITNLNNVSDLQKIIDQNLVAN